MSNDPVRVTFPDGRVLFGIGDSSAVVSQRLYPSKEEAWAAYCDDSIYEPIADSYDAGERLIKLADLAAEDVLMETTYGSRDYSWREMLYQNARANFGARLITCLPSFEVPE